MLRLTCWNSEGGAKNFVHSFLGDGDSYSGHSRCQEEGRKHAVAAGIQKARCEGSECRGDRRIAYCL